MSTIKNTHFYVLTDMTLIGYPMLDEETKEGAGRESMAAQLPQQQQHNQGLIRQHLAQQQTMPNRAITLPEVIGAISLSSSARAPDMSLEQAVEGQPEQVASTPISAKKQSILRVVAIVLTGILGLSLYFIWHASTPPTSSAVPVITQQQFNAVSPVAKSKTAAGASPVAANGKIQVYIVGAVKHPGVYTLEANARLYQLLQAAGGPLPNANMVALNLAARLIDGQEIYVVQIGETPPAYTGGGGGANTDGANTGTAGVTAGQQININTATADELRQGLRVSSATAQAIINYRIQHGSYTSVEELSQVVSKAIYTKIKGQVTVA
jgi:competence protein ComEA